MKSNYFLISIDDSGLDYKGNIGDKNVYTYNLSEVIIEDFFANKVSLTEALDKKQIAIKPVQSCLQKSDSKNVVLMYTKTLLMFVLNMGQA